MKEKYFAFVRMFIFIVSAIGMIMVVAGVISDLSKPGVALSIKGNSPEVSFSNFEKFKNYTAPVEVKVSTAELKKEQDRFHSAFFKHSQDIFSNISKYSSALDQAELDHGRFDEYLFNLLTAYNIDLRVLYLEQLSSESKSLLKYADVLNKNRDKKTILWSEFLDWFSSDFNDQLQTNDQKEVSDENHFLSKEMLVIFMLLVIILLLSRYSLPSSKEKTEEEPQEELSSEDEEETEEEASPEIKEDENSEEKK